MADYTEGLLWGCPQMNFKANPPFNEMRQGFATFDTTVITVTYHGVNAKRVNKMA